MEMHKEKAKAIAASGNGGSGGRALRKPFDPETDLDIGKLKPKKSGGLGTSDGFNSRFSHGSRQFI